MIALQVIIQHTVTTIKRLGLSVIARKMTANLLYSERSRYFDCYRTISYSTWACARRHHSIFSPDCPLLWEVPSKPRLSTWCHYHIQYAKEETCRNTSLIHYTGAIYIQPNSLRYRVSYNRRWLATTLQERKDAHLKMNQTFATFLQEQNDARLETDQARAALPSLQKLKNEHVNWKSCG